MFPGFKEMCPVSSYIFPSSSINDSISSRSKNVDKKIKVDRMNKKQRNPRKKIRIKAIRKNIKGDDLSMKYKKSLEKVLEDILVGMGNIVVQESSTNNGKHILHFRIKDQGYSITIEENEAYSKTNEEIYSEKLIDLENVLSSVINDCRQGKYSWSEGLSQIKGAINNE